MISQQEKQGRKYEYV